VLAGGIDIVYPPENADLQHAIGEKGLPLSERSPGFAPRAKDFPCRNRLISGISAWRRSGGSSRTFRPVSRAVRCLPCREARSIRALRAQITCSGKARVSSRVRATSSKLWPRCSGARSNRLDLSSPLLGRNRARTVARHCANRAGAQSRGKLHGTGDSFSHWSIRGMIVQSWRDRSKCASSFAMARR
jgi:hypothetical protein